MRAALLLLPLAACLSQPDGKPQVWPPPHLDVISADSGDLDEDGVDDLVVLSAGSDDDDGGVYLLRGGVDLPDALTFTAVAALDVGRPAQVLVADLQGDTHPEVVVIADGDDGLYAAAFDAALAPLTTTDVGTGSVADDGKLHAVVVPYPTGAQLLVMAGNVRRAAADELVTGEPEFDDVDLPSLIPTTAAELAITYHDQGDNSWALILASAMGIWKAALAPTGSVQGQWAQIRSGAFWPEMIAFDAAPTGGVNPVEVVGIQGPTGDRELCAHDLYTEQPIACSPTGAVPLDARGLLTGDLTTGGGPDLAVLADPGAGAVPMVIADVRATDPGGPVLHDAPVAWQGAPFPAWAFAIVGHQLLLVDPHGPVTCLAVVDGALDLCAP